MKFSNYRKQDVYKMLLKAAVAFVILIVALFTVYRIAKPKVDMWLLERKEAKEKREAERLKKERLYALMRDTGIYYHNNLMAQKTGEVVDYINHRKLTRNTIKTFGMGYSSGFSELIDFLREKGYTQN